jgi:hypothetical protein
MTSAFVTSCASRAPLPSMSSTIDFRLVMRPELCDIVRMDWATDILPDDGAFLRCILKISPTLM